jgi:hypothetical protein
VFPVWVRVDDSDPPDVMDWVFAPAVVEDIEPVLDVPGEPVLEPVLPLVEAVPVDIVFDDPVVGMVLLIPVAGIVLLIPVNAVSLVLLIMDDVVEKYSAGGFSTGSAATYPGTMTVPVTVLNSVHS